MIGALVILGVELICVLFTLLCVIAAGFLILDKIWARIAESRRKAQDDPRPGWQFRADLQALDRWCCWHFPITEDICAWLLSPDRRIDEFREHLIQKYGDRENLK